MKDINLEPRTSIPVSKPIGLFTFDAGQGLSQHSAPFDAVVQVLDKEDELIVGGGLGCCWLLPVADIDIEIYNL